MNKNNTILAFLGHEMTDSDRTEFELQLQSDQELAAEVDTMRTVLEGIELAGEDKMRAQLQQMMSAAPPTRVVPMWSRPRFWAAAAALAGVVLSVWLLWRNPVSGPAPVAEIPAETAPVQPSPIPAVEPGAPVKDTPPSPPASPSRYLALAQEHYQTPSFSHLRGGDNAHPAVDSAYILMNQKNWAKAIEWIKKHPMGTQSDVLLAHAYMSMRQYKRAQILFSSIVNRDEMPWSEESQYYLLLCYLARYETEQAQFEALAPEILSDPGHPDYERVKKLFLDVGNNDLQIVNYPTIDINDLIIKK